MQRSAWNVPKVERRWVWLEGSDSSRGTKEILEEAEIIMTKVSLLACPSSGTGPLKYTGKKCSWLHAEEGIVLGAAREAGSIGKKPHTFPFFSVIKQQIDHNCRISLVISCLFSWGDQSMKFPNCVKTAHFSANSTECTFQGENFNN